MYQGLHAPNKAFTQADYDVIRIMQAQSVKLLTITGCQHTVDDVAHLRALGVNHFSVRLWDSKDASGRTYGDEEYADKCIETINDFYRAGVFLFELDNEGNWSWTKKGMGPFEYQWFMKRVVPRIRAKVPANVKLVSPPLSFSPALWTHDPPNTPPEKRRNPTDFILDDWFDAYAFTNEGKEPSLWSLFDLVGANCYGQSAGQMEDPSYGECYKVVSQKAGGKRAVITEWASSAHLLTNPDGSSRYWPAEVEALRIAQYPVYQERARDSGIVEASYAFLPPGSTDDWHGFRISPALAQAMKVVPTPTNL